MDINSWIEEVHRNKHNMIPVVKLAISKPIEALLETTNLTNDFPISLLPFQQFYDQEQFDHPYAKLSFEQLHHLNHPQVHILLEMM